MKKAMLILGIIGALIALVGSLVTMIGGFGGTAIGIAGNSDATAYSGTFVFWSGALAVVTAALALIFSVVGGLSRKKISILAFAAGTTATGLLSIYLYNWFSGAIVTIAGIPDTGLKPHANAEAVTAGVQHHAGPRQHRVGRKIGAGEQQKATIFGARFNDNVLV